MRSPGARSGRLPRLVPLALVPLALVGGLAGCVAPFGLERGFSGRDAEWQRTRPVGEFSVISASADRAVVLALGHQIAVEPAAGFCLTSEAIETSDRSAFLLLGDCALEETEGDAAGAGGGDGALDLPRGVPGIITVSISGDPGFSPVEAEEDLTDLQRFLESADGRAMLGRGGAGDQVSVVETRAIGNILYVLVEDADGSVPVLAPRFWRAFVELNDRLTVVSISGFRDRPLPEDEMLRHLGDQVRQLQVANSEPLDEAPVQVAGAPPPRAPAWPSLAPRTEEEAIEQAIEEEEVEETAPEIADIEPTSIIVATKNGDEGFWPVPARRQASAMGGPAAGEPTALAPAAPLRRPGEPGGAAGASAPSPMPTARPRR